MMKSKKQLLFVIDSLGIGGAEKSLVTLLNVLDYSRFEVDVQLFAYGRAFQPFLPAAVHLLPELETVGRLSQPWRRLLRHPSLLWSKIGYSLKIRLRKRSVSECACLWWRHFGRYIGPAAKRYDVAIAYAQGVPTFYTVDKVTASRKMAWVNGVYRITGKVRDFQRRFYGACDTIVPVSEQVRDIFAAEVYPEFGGKMQVMWDITDGALVARLAALPSEKPVDASRPVVMTVGRLIELKGYRLALAAARILRDRGVAFRWYAVGEGSLRAELERLIAENGLGDHFVLLGETANPYSCMRQCDVYVQPSLREGFGLTIAEARILNKPVVCTQFEGCTVQVTHEKNGLITSFDPEAIADAVERLLTDKELYAALREQLRTEKKGNTEAVETFYRLIAT